MTDIAARLEEANGQLTGPGAPFEIISQTFDGIQYRAFKNVPPSVKEMLDIGRQHGEQTYICYEEERWSFNDFFQQVDAIGHQLVHRYGVQKGDRVAIAMRNYPEWLTAFVAIVSLGAVAVPLNSWGRRDELLFGIKDSGAQILFCDAQRLRYVADDLSELNVRAVVARPDDVPLPPQAEHLDAFLDNVGKVDLPAYPVEPEDPAMIMYTSGTTGHPKGAISTQRQIGQALMAFELNAASSAMLNMDTVRAMMESGFEPAILLAVPLFHVSGLHALALLSLRGGRKLVMMYKWDAGQALKLIEKERLSALTGAPSMVMDVLDHPDFDQYDTSSLFAVSGAGSAAPPRLAELIKARLARPYPGAGYGMTETNAVGSSGTGIIWERKPRSAGVLSPIVEFRTVDEQGRELPRGEVGEIWLKSPTIIKEYWQRPDDSRETFHDGWIATGDIGYIDDENYVFLVDRAKDIIIRGGENIASAEIEVLLHSHPDVHEVAAFGVPHPRLGEEVAVAVVAKEGRQIDVSSIRDFVSEHLAGFKVPAHVWVRSEALPRNPSGKVIKNPLREEWLKMQEAS